MQEREREKMHDITAEGETSWDSTGQMQFYITYFKRNPVQITVTATTIKTYLPLQMDWMMNVRCE